MNAKTARLIRKTAGVEGYRQAKKDWNKIPKQRRHAMRVRMKEAL